MKVSRKKIIKFREELPYGIIINDDGSYLFNREYNLIYFKSFSGPVKKLFNNYNIVKGDMGRLISDSLKGPDSTTNISTIKNAGALKSFYYDSSNTPWENKKSLTNCMNILNDWGVDFIT